MVKFKIIDTALAAALLNASGYADIADMLLAGDINVRQILGLLGSVLTDPAKRTQVIQVIGVGALIKALVGVFGMNRGYELTDKITIGL